VVSFVDSPGHESLMSNMRAGEERREGGRGGGAERGGGRQPEAKEQRGVGE